jgi:hypothetical protein
MIIYEKLHKIQQALKVPKDAVNTFGNYNYRTAESILRAFKEKNDELNLGLVLVLDDEIIYIEGRFYVRAIATLSDGSVWANDKGIETITASAYAREAENKKGMDEAQVTGAASSYARKYGLAGLFAIDAEDKDDPDAQEPVTEAKTTKPAKGQQQIIF